MTVVTIYALFGDDYRLIYAPVEEDSNYSTLSIVSMILFSLEIILSSIGHDHYLFSFFFWLDLISTVSMITDIPPVMDALMSTDDSQIDSDNPVALARASRGARIGTKAGRLVRIVRLIRLIRIVKLYKSAN